MRRREKGKNRTKEKNKEIHMRNIDNEDSNIKRIWHKKDITYEWYYVRVISCKNGVPIGTLIFMQTKKRLRDAI